MRKREDSPAEVLESILLLLAEVGEAVVRDGSNRPLVDDQSSHGAVPNPHVREQTPHLEDQMQVRYRGYR